MKIALVCPASLPATQFGGILFLAVDIAREATNLGNNVVIYTTDLDFANNAKTFNKDLPREEMLDEFYYKTISCMVQNKSVFCKSWYIFSNDERFS